MEILLPSISLETLTMEANSILRADLLDILFENRNKEYGAYELRKTYNKRITYAVAAMFMLCLLLIVISIFAGSKKSSANEKLYVKDFELIKAPDEKDKEEIKQPPVKHEVQQVATRRVTIPIIVRNDDVKPEDRPPANDELDNVQIRLENKNGTPDMGAPPLTESTGNVEAPKQIKHGDDSFHQVQIEAQFPGGLGAWTKYLESNLRTEVPLDNGAPAGRYTVFKMEEV